jgi:phosphinothricin acetyltransferase
MTSPIVRDATVEDVPGMLEIYRPIVTDTPVSFELEPPTVEEFTERFSRITESDPWLVAVQDGSIAGYAYASEWRARPAYVATRETTVFVHYDHQRKGIARLLMTELLTRLTAAGAHVVVAGVTLPNGASVSLHEGLGFEHVGTYSEVGRKFDRWHDVGFWALRLS